MADPDTDDYAEEAEEQDRYGMDAAMTILRDVMGSYDWSSMLDVRDRLFVSRLREALDLLGVELRLDVVTTEQGAEAELTLTLDGEVVGFHSSATGTAHAALMAAREAFTEAGLLTPLMPLDADGAIRMHLLPRS